MSLPLPLSALSGPDRSESESTTFGFAVDRVTIGGAWSDAVADEDALIEMVADRLDTGTARLTIVRYPSNCVSLARSITARSDVHVLAAGTIVYWEDQSVEAPAGDSASSASLRSEQEVEEALEVIVDSFSGYRNHYSYNSQLPEGTTTAAYRDWARSRLQDATGVGVVLRDDDGAAVGCATLRRFSDSAGDVEVELAGIASRAQGSGQYARLWALVRDAAARCGATRILISTQAANAGVQRAWARLGLLPLSAFDTVHVMREPR